MTFTVENGSLLVPCPLSTEYMVIRRMPGLKCYSVVITGQVRGENDLDDI